MSKVAGELDGDAELSGHLLANLRAYLSVD